MDIIHDITTLPRLIGAALSERLSVMPAVVVTGAPQSGKSTFAEHLVPGARGYATLDGLEALDAARRDPEVLVGGPGAVTLDEVQREPELLRAVKRAELGYWRTSVGEEVDFVIESEGKLLPIEVQAIARPRLADIPQLRAFRAQYGKKARTGLLLHTGNTLEWLVPDVLAAPWWRVL